MEAITFTKSRTVPGSAGSSHEGFVDVFDEEPMKMDSEGNLFDSDMELVEKPCSTQVETIRSLADLTIVPEYFIYESGRIIDVSTGYVVVKGRSHRPEDLVTFDNASHEELSDFLYDYVSESNFRDVAEKIALSEYENVYDVLDHLCELTRKHLKRVFEKLSLVEAFNEYISSKRAEKQKLIEEGWQKISTPEIDSYINNPNSLLNLRTLILFARIMDEDILCDCGQSFTDNTYELLDMVDPVFHGKRNESNLCSYYGYIVQNMVDDLVYHDRVDKNESFDTYELVKKLSKMNWKHNYSSPSVEIYFGDSPTDILVIFIDDKGALFLQHEGKFVHVGRTCHYSCLRTNTYYETDDNTFVNGYRTDFCGADAETAFETFIGMSGPSCESDEEGEEENETTEGPKIDWDKLGGAMYHGNLAILETILPNMSQEELLKKMNETCWREYSIEVVRTFLKYYKGDLRSTMRYAAKYGQLDVMKLLQEFGATLEPIDGLLGAAARGTPCSRHSPTNVIRYLVENGANIDYQDGHCGTPLYKTIPYQIESAKLLINLGADVNSGSTGIFRGFDSCVAKARRESCGEEILAMLLAAGAKE